MSIKTNLNKYTFGTGVYSAVVGSPTQVTNGLANYSSIQAAHDAISYGIILILAGTYTENLVLTKPLTLVGQGASTIIDGTVNLNSGASYMNISLVFFNGNVTIDSSVSKAQILQFQAAVGVVISDNAASGENLTLGTR